MSVDILAILPVAPPFSLGSGGGGLCDYPAESDVRLGVVYGNGLYTGTLIGGGTGPLPPYDDNSPNVSSHPPARIVLKLIQDLGYIGTVAESMAGDIWKGYSPNEPDSPDYVIVTQDTEGQDLGRVQVGPRSELYGVQLRVRARRSDEAYAKAANIAIALDGMFNRDVVIDGTTYLVNSIVRRGKPMVLGHDATSKRYIVTMNLMASISQRPSE